MAGLGHFLRCVGKAVLKHGPRSLAGLVPLGDNLYDIACDALADYLRENADAKVRSEIQALAQATPEEAKRAAEAVVRQVAADQPPAVQQALTAYLSQVPAAIRQSLRRPADPSGTTVPAILALRRPEDLPPFLPQRLPRFKPGTRPVAGIDREPVELLGTGGFGEVWTAHNPYQESAPVVALKFCLDLDPAAVKALENEAKLLYRITQDGRPAGLVRLHHTYLSAALPCLEYEYVAGGDLAGLIRERHAAGKMRAEEAARLMLQVARAVAYAHQRGIVHRDLKPANILVGRTAEGGLRLKVADFGIGGPVARQALARAGGRVHTTRNAMTQALRGAYSPPYASPQQVRGEPPNPRDDVYALGVVWYQMLTGDLTSGAPNGMSWAMDLAGVGVAKSHLALMTACFETNPAARPVDAADLAKRLGKLLAPAAPPVQPIPEEPRRRTAEPKSRPFPPLVAWGAAAAALLCVVIGVTLALSAGRNRMSERGDSTSTAGSNELPEVLRSLPGGQEAEVEVASGVKMKFCWIPPGQATLGSPTSEKGRESNETEHEYTSRGFWLAKYPVTQQQWKALMGNNTSGFTPAQSDVKKAGINDTSLPE